MGISIGLVGLGEFGRSFADLFKRHPLVDRVGLCDLEPDRIATWAEREDWQDKFDPSDAYASLDDICASDLDALVIITQHWLHAPQCVQAMESGKHVYSAVPVISVPDADEILDWCDRLVETSRRTGMHYMLGETTIYRPETMFCRRMAAEGAFGLFVHAEGQYFHDVDDPGCNLRDVMKHRTTGRAGEEWRAISKAYADRGVVDGPMHYPTHSVSGPVSVMRAHMTKVVAYAQYDQTGDPHFADSTMNEVAFFHMSNGATCRIAECRRIGHAGEETFRVFGTQGSYREESWVTKDGWRKLSVEEMRDPLPPEVAHAFGADESSDAYGGHGGSHAYLVHEFVDAVAHDRTPEINVCQAARYMAPGAVAHKSALLGGELLDVPDWGDAP